MDVDIFIPIIFGIVIATTIYTYFIKDSDLTTGTYKEFTDHHHAPLHDDDEAWTDFNNGFLLASTVIYQTHIYDSTSDDDDNTSSYDDNSSSYDDTSPSDDL